MNINNLIKVITENTSNRFVIGVDGLSRSGKTTFVKRLEGELKQKSIPFHIFHIDDHIAERDKRYFAKVRRHKNIVRNLNGDIGKRKIFI